MEGWAALGWNLTTPRFASGAIVLRQAVDAFFNDVVAAAPDIAAHRHTRSDAFAAAVRARIWDFAARHALMLDAKAPAAGQCALALSDALLLRFIARSALLRLGTAEQAHALAADATSMLDAVSVFAPVDRLGHRAAQLRTVRAVRVGFGDALATVKVLAPLTAASKSSNAAVPAALLALLVATNFPSATAAAPGATVVAPTVASAFGLADAQVVALVEAALPSPLAAVVRPSGVELQTPMMTSAAADAARTASAQIFKATRSLAVGCAPEVAVTLEVLHSA
jgi:hypothetical protein